MTIFSLPREIRDQIYKLRLVSSQPVSFDSSKSFICVIDEQQKCLGLMNYASNPFDVEGPALLGLLPSGLSVAKESREIFYRHNTFKVTGERVQRFLEVVPFHRGRICHPLVGPGLGTSSSNMLMSLNRILIGF